MSVILLVDDSPSDRALFRAILTRGGFEVREAAYGRDVRARVAESRPLAVVLDVNLPDMDGHSVCRELRSDPSLNGLPVLMLTVRDDERDIIEGLEAGADDYVAKDSAPEIILARVRRLVRFRQMASVAILNERLIQIGRLLAGIVHEIRGPLSVIRGNAEMMQLKLGREHESSVWVEPILRHVQVLQKRLEHLMAAVRTGPPVLAPIELPPLVREATDLFLRGVDPYGGGRVAIETEFAEDLPRVRADGGRLLQVFMNLFGNAQEVLREARPDGRVVVRALRTECSAGQPWVTVTVADNGPGIPSQYLDRIFEPFFTTKGEGSGYGLYLASEILREHAGRLTASNGADGGAQFTLWLPIEAEAALPTPSEAPA